MNFQTSIMIFAGCKRNSIIINNSSKTSHMEKHKNRLHCKEKMNKKKA